MSILRVVSEMDTIPRGYGVAWVDNLCCRAVCAPYGLHLIIGLVRSLYVELRFWFTPPSSIDVIRQHAYREGKKSVSGYLEHRAYRRGYEDGVEAFKSELKKAFTGRSQS